jgi:hypothetical protein
MTLANPLLTLATVRYPATNLAGLIFPIDTKQLFAIRKSGITTGNN